MNEPDTPIDDEVVSAVLDGESTPAERALVEGSAAGRRRLEELRAVRSRLSESVEPLPAGTVERLVGRALADLPSEAAGPDVGPATVSELDDARSRPSAPHRRWGQAVAAAAAVVVVLGGLVALVRVAGEGSSSDSASSGDASTALVENETSGGSSAADHAAPEAAGAENSRPADAGSLLDLGPYEDAEAVLDAYQTSTMRTTDGAPEDSASRRQRQSLPLVQQYWYWFSEECAARIRETAPDVGQVVATASVDGRAVTVLAAGAPPTVSHLVVVTEEDCTVLADRPV